MFMMLCIMKIELLMKYMEKKKLILRLKLYVLNFIFCDLEKYRFNVKLFIWIFFFKFVCICNLKIYVCLIGF